MESFSAHNWLWVLLTSSGQISGSDKRILVTASIIERFPLISFGPILARETCHIKQCLPLAGEQ